MDRTIYESDKRILEKEFEKINIKEHEINPRGNYTLSKIQDFIFRFHFSVFQSWRLQGLNPYEELRVII